MKRTLLFTSLLFLFFAGHAQFTLQPDPSGVTFDTNNPEHWDIHADASLHYSGNNTANLRWDIINISGPKEWAIYTCLGQACYAPGQFSGETTIGPNETIAIQAHILPNGGCGQGSYNITFTDLATGNVVATGTFNFECLVSSTNSFNTSKGGNVYPNPVTTWFSLSDTPGAHRVELYNIIGKQVAQFEYQAGRSYDVAFLSSGMYMVRILDRQGKVIASRRVSKQTP